MATPIVGDRVSVRAKTTRVIVDYASEMATPSIPNTVFYIRASDVGDDGASFSGTVTAVRDRTVEVEVFSPTDQYELTLSLEEVTVLPYQEDLVAGHKYRQFGTFDPTWLYDGEAFYPIETFPEGAVDRDQLPRRLEDLGHLRDY